MSERQFKKVPNTLTLNLFNVYKNTTLPYTYIYDETNNKWNINSTQYNGNIIDLSTEGLNDEYLPQDTYNIINGIGTGDILTDCTTIEEIIPPDLDFNPIDVELSSFYSVAVPWYFDYNAGYNDKNFREFKKSVCNNTPLDYYYYYITRLGYQATTDYYDYKFVGEPNQQNLMTGIGSNITIKSSNDNSYIYTVSKNIKYNKPYKLFPKITYVDKSDVYESYFSKISLIYNCYVDWSTYFNNITSSIQNNIALSDKYTGITYDAKNSTISINNNNTKECIDTIFGFSDDSLYRSNNCTVLYYADIECIKQGKQGHDSNHIIFTNLDTIFQFYALNTWDKDSNGNIIGNITNKNNFIKIIDVFTGSIENNIRYATKGTDLIEFISDIDDPTNITTESVDNFYNNYISAWGTNAGITGLSSLTTGLWNTIFMFQSKYDGKYNYDSINGLYNYPNSNFYNYIDFISYNSSNIIIRTNVTFYIIQRQSNIVNNDIINKYSVKIINKILPLSVYRQPINESLNSSFNAFIDYPIVSYDIYDNTCTYIREYGIANSVNKSNGYYDKFYAGTMYSIVEKITEDSPNNQSIYTYYNYALNKQASCNGSNPLTWSNMPTS